MDSESMPEKLLELELELKKIQIQELIDDISERRKYRKWSFILVVVWPIAVATFMIVAPSVGTAGFPVAAITLLIGQIALRTISPLYGANMAPTLLQTLKNKISNRKILKQ